MTITVSLRNFVDEMQIGSDGLHAYLNQVTGELVTISDDDIEVVQSGEDWADYQDWQQSIFQNIAEILSPASEYLELPSKFEINEYEIMRDFCLSIANEEDSDLFLAAIRGSGAFRRFKDLIYRYGIEQDWFKFRDDAYKKVAVSWLESNGFDYTDDMNRGQ